MVRVVQKYGGTSVADLERIRSVAGRIKRCYEQENQIIVVVSARAGVTDELINKAHHLSKNPDAAELDALLCVGECETIALLAIALNDIGIPAVSFNAHQAKISTCSSFGSARIQNIIGDNIENCLNDSKVAVVAGFQGITNEMRLTTLGRGGSDLTALALAYRFKADKCEIYSDVDGVFSGDPRVIEGPKFIENISHDSLLRLSFLDNKIMQDRSVAFAQKMGVDFTIASSFSSNNKKHTNVVNDLPHNESCVIGITHKTGLLLVSGIVEIDIFKDVLEFFAQNRIEVSFIKHSRLLDREEFLDEISIENSSFMMIRNEFYEKFRNFYKSISLSEDLIRIDVVGTQLEYSDWLDRILEIAYENHVYRSEYGKNGLSFLIQASDYKSTLNRIHGIIFQ